MGGGIMKVPYQTENNFCKAQIIGGELSRYFPGVETQEGQDQKACKPVSVILKTWAITDSGGMRG